jgi:gelsolin
VPKNQYGIIPSFLSKKKKKLIKQIGSFHTGDSYIVLNTYKPRPDSDKLAYDGMFTVHCLIFDILLIILFIFIIFEKQINLLLVHFWLGTYTTQDEAGTAAYKTVELDDFVCFPTLIFLFLFLNILNKLMSSMQLGGLPVQYREVQGYESGRFLSHFKGGVRLLEGGVETGFHHVEPEKYRPRLLHLKGKKHIRVHEVPKTYKSLNSGDVFVLDAGKVVIQWNGSKSGILEKAKVQASNYDNNSVLTN